MTVKRRNRRWYVTW